MIVHLLFCYMENFQAIVQLGFCLDLGRERERDGIQI